MPCLVLRANCRPRPGCNNPTTDELRMKITLLQCCDYGHLKHNFSTHQRIQYQILSYLCVVHLGDVRVGVHVGPHQRSDQRHGGRGRGVLRALGLGGKTTSPPLEAVRPDHLLDHAGGQALLEPAELAAVPPPLVHGAALVRQTHVLGVLLHRPLEEPLAALAGPHPVVLARGVVPAHGAHQPAAAAAGARAGRASGLQSEA